MQSEIRDIIYKYYIDPIISDAGYNIVNTITWALVLGVCIFGVQKVLRHLNIVIDRRFVIGVVSYVLFGSSLRVLEDADLFAPPLNHLFVTPVIYFVVFFVTVISLALSLRIYHEKSGGSITDCDTHRPDHISDLSIFPTHEYQVPVKQIQHRNPRGASL